MGEFKGTKENLGVWQYGNDLVVSTPEGGHICVLKLPEHSDKWHEYVRANAALMSAAPQLLEAIQDMLSGWKYIREQHGDLYGVGWDRAEQKAATAIAKALGSNSQQEKYMDELTVQQYAAILQFINEDLLIFEECCEEGSVDFEETLAMLKRLAGSE